MSDSESLPGGLRILPGKETRTYEQVRDQLAAKAARLLERGGAIAAGELEVSERERAFLESRRGDMDASDPVLDHQRGQAIGARMRRLMAEAEAANGDRPSILIVGK